MTRIRYIADSMAEAVTAARRHHGTGVRIVRAGARRAAGGRGLSFEVVVEEVRGSGKGHPPILPVLSMLDLRRNLHRQAREANPTWPVIPLASSVEQCAVERQPVGAFAPRSPAAKAFAQLWTAIERKLAGK